MPIVISSSNFPSLTWMSHSIHNMRRLFLQPCWYYYIRCTWVNTIQNILYKYDEKLIIMQTHLLDALETNAAMLCGSNLNIQHHARTHTHFVENAHIHIWSSLLSAALQPATKWTISNINVTFSWVGLITFSFIVCPNSVAWLEVRGKEFILNEMRCSQRSQCKSNTGAPSGDCNHSMIALDE